MPRMKIEGLHIGMKVRHPKYGVGTVKSIGEKTADIRFEDALRTLDPELSEITAAEPSASISGLDVPLGQFVESAVEAVIGRLGFEIGTVPAIVEYNKYPHQERPGN